MKKRSNRTIGYSSLSPPPFPKLSSMRIHHFIFVTRFNLGREKMVVIF